MDYTLNNDPSTNLIIFRACTSTINTGSIPNQGTCYTVSANCQSHWKISLKISMHCKIEMTIELYLGCIDALDWVSINIYCSTCLNSLLFHSGFYLYLFIVVEGWWMYISRWLLARKLRPRIWSMLCFSVSIYSTIMKWMEVLN